MADLIDRGKREFTKSELESIIEGAIDLAVDSGILNPCAVRVKKDGVEYIEYGFKIADDYTLEQLERLAYGAEEVK